MTPLEAGSKLCQLESECASIEDYDREVEVLQIALTDAGHSRIHGELLKTSREFALDFIAIANGDQVTIKRILSNSTEANRSAT